MRLAEIRELDIGIRQRSGGVVALRCHRQRRARALHLHLLRTQDTTLGLGHISRRLRDIGHGPLGFPLFLRGSQALTDCLKLRIDGGLEGPVGAAEVGVLVAEVREIEPGEVAA